MQKEQTLKRQASYLFLGRIISFILQFIVPVILVRVLSKSQYGIYQQTIMISIFFASILQMGMTNSLFYFYPNANDTEKNQLIFQTYFFLIFFALIFSPLLILLKVPIANFFHNKYFISLIYSISFYTFFYLASSLLDFIFIVEKKVYFVFLYLVGNQFLRIIFLVTSALIFKNVKYMIWGLVFFSFIKSIFLFFYLKSNYNLTFKNFNKEYFKSQISYAFPMGFAKIVGNLGKKIDKFLISNLLTSSDFAIYSVANFKLPFLQLIYTSLGNVTLQKISKYAKNNDSINAHKLWKRMIISYSLVTIPTILYFFFVTKNFIILLYGEKYIEGVPIFQIFLIILLIQMLSYGTILKAYKKTKYIFMTNFFSTIIGLIMGYIFIKNFGMIGAAISVVFSFSINAILQLYKTKKVLEINFFNFLPYKKMFFIMVLSLIPIPVIFLIQHIFTNNFIILSLSFSFYFIFFFLFLMLFKIISIDLKNKKIKFNFL